MECNSSRDRQATQATLKNNLKFKTLAPYFLALVTIIQKYALLKIVLDVCLKYLALEVRTRIVLASVFNREKNGFPFLSKFLIGIEVDQRTIVLCVE